MLDIRIPIGLMFAILGPILVVFGLVSGPEIYERHSLGVNVNLWWGFVLVGVRGLHAHHGLPGQPKDEDARGKPLTAA